MSGPLTGVRIVELGGIGAAPYGCMMLADMGAEVVRVERATESHVGMHPDSPLLRNRRSVSLDLKQPEGRDAALALVRKADVLIDPFRPGVTERLGIGPDACQRINNRLVYARMTGWGQTGPMASMAGHDLNYIAMSGLLHQIGNKDDKPAVPLNVIGDFGGGGMLLAFGVVCALLETKRSGIGQVVDAAMIDGAASFMAMFFGDREVGQFDDRTGSHMLGGAAHYYDTYRTKDGRALAVAPIEPQFYRKFLDKLGIEDERWVKAGFPAHSSRVVAEEWPELKAELTKVFASKTRDEWCELFAGSDVCVTPVLTLNEATEHEHNLARDTFITVGGVMQNAPAPRFSRTKTSTPRAPVSKGADTDDVLREWGVELPQ